MKGFIGDLLAELGPLLGEVLESGIFRQALLGAEAVEALWCSICEAVSLQRCVLSCLLLELCERVGARRTLWSAEEGHNWSCDGVESLWLLCCESERPWTDVCAGDKLTGIV